MNIQELHYLLFIFVFKIKEASPEKSQKNTNRVLPNPSPVEALFYYFQIEFNHVTISDLIYPVG